MGLLHLAAARRSRVEALLERQVTAIGYETIQTDDGALPVLMPLSQVAGRMLVQVAATAVPPVCRPGKSSVFVSGRRPRRM